MSRLMWDVFYGLGGASAAFKAKGWRVVSVDNEPAFRPSILRDVRQLKGDGSRPDFMWFSPPCTEYAMRRFKRDLEPSPELVLECVRLRDEFNPRYWALENVRLSVPFISKLLGARPVASVGPFFLWGNFPRFIPRPCPAKGDPTGPHWLRAAERAKVPLTLSADMEAHITYLLDQEDGARQPSLFELSIPAPLDYAFERGAKGATA